jgi:hypothetical protein
MPGDGGSLLEVVGVRVDPLVKAWPTMSQQGILRAPDISIQVTGVYETYAATGETLADALTNSFSPDLPNPKSTKNDGHKLVLARREQWRANSRVMPRVNRRRLGRTNRGFVGLFPAEAKTDDEMWLTHCSNMFYVLRQCYLRKHKAHWRGLYPRFNAGRAER